jgi:hypothetical protein
MWNCVSAATIRLLHRFALPSVARPPARTVFHKHSSRVCRGSILEDENSPRTPHTSTPRTLSCFRTRVFTPRTTKGGNFWETTNNLKHCPENILVRQNNYVRKKPMSAATFITDSILSTQTWFSSTIANVRISFRKGASLAATQLKASVWGTEKQWAVWWEMAVTLHCVILLLRCGETMSLKNRASNGPSLARIFAINDITVINARVLGSTTDRSSRMWIASLP